MGMKSAEQSNADGFTVFCIMARRGYEVDKFSLFPDEAEVVLLPNTRFESWGTVTRPTQVN